MGSAPVPISVKLLSFFARMNTAKSMFSSRPTSVEHAQGLPGVFGEVLLVQQDEPVVVFAHERGRVLAAPGDPIGVHLGVHQAGVCVLHNDVVHQLVPKALELLVVVMVVKAHAPLLAQLADAVEHPAPPLYIVHVP